MKIKPLFNYTNATDFLVKYLGCFGVKEDKINKFTIPDLTCFDDPREYKNMEEASLRLDKAVKNKEKIGILVDKQHCPR